MDWKPIVIYGLVIITGLLWWMRRSANKRTKR
jgi:hypothetical protein